MHCVSPVCVMRPAGQPGTRAGWFREMGTDITEQPPAAGAAVSRSRGISTARTVLHLLSLLARAEDGMRADDVAEALGKSTSTAYSLLDTLCQERFVVHAGDGSYHLTTEAAGFVPAAGGGTCRTASAASSTSCSPERASASTSPRPTPARS
jgi:hypothetical protein